MVELDEATRRSLLAREGPPPGANAEVLASLRARLGTSGPGEGGSGAGAEGGSGAGAGGSGSQLAWAAKVVAATAGLTSAGLLTLKLAALVLLGPSPEPGSAPEQPSPVAVDANEVEVPKAVERSEVSEASQPSSFARGAAREPVSSSARAPAKKPTVTAAPPESTLAAELELVRAAKRLRAADPKAALAELERHRERFPSGTLAPERELLRVEITCELGPRSAAAKARAQFISDFPDSPLRARLAKTCAGGTELAGAGD